MIIELKKLDNIITELTDFRFEIWNTLSINIINLNNFTEIIIFYII